LSEFLILLLGLLVGASTVSFIRIRFLGQNLQRMIQNYSAKNEEIAKRVEEQYEETTYLLKQTKNTLEKLELLVNTKGDPELGKDASASEEVTPSEEGSKNDEKDTIKNFLESKGINIKRMPPESEADEVINDLSNFLGRDYNSLSELLAVIKKKMQQGQPFSLSLRNYTQDDISKTCQFCKKLHQVAFLEEYRYFKSPRFLITAKPSRLPKAINFFSGQWLERFALLCINSAIDSISNQLDREKSDFEFLINPQVLLPNGDDFELDIMFRLEDRFFWVETKSGNYQQHIHKYYDLSRKLNLSQNEIILVLADVPFDQSKRLSSLYSMSVCSPQQMEATLTEILEEN